MTFVHLPRETVPAECRAIGPERTLWGQRTDLVCTRPKGHVGDHCDQAITGYSNGNWWPS